MSFLSAPPRPLRIFIGTYTSGESRGVYTATFDPAAGRLSAAVLAAEMPDPSFLAISPDGGSLYATEESATAVRAFAIGAEGALSPLGAGDTGGAAPCHLAVHPGGRSLFVANYNGGSVAAFPIGADGAIGARSGFYQHAGSSVHPHRQTKPHAHGVTFSADGRFLLVPDLGLDEVKSYRVDPAAATVEAHAPGALASSPARGRGTWRFRTTTATST